MSPGDHLEPLLLCLNIHWVVLFLELKFHVRDTRCDNVFIYGNYIESDCVRNIRRIFQRKFQGVTIPYRSNIHEIINKLRQSLCWTKTNRNNTPSKCRSFMDVPEMRNNG
jgi:hypothetical protein